MITIDETAFYTIKDLEGMKLAEKVTIRNWIKSGKLKASRLGRKYLISGKVLKVFLSNGTDK